MGVSYRDDWQYAQSVLRGTYIEYDNHLWYVDAVEPHTIVISREDIAKAIPLSTRIKPVELGYINVRGRALYLQRGAERQFRQGLNAGRVQGLATNHDNFITNTYPSFDAAYNMLVNNVANEVAFDRHWSIARLLKRQYKIQRRGRLVAEYKDNAVSFIDRVVSPEVTRYFEAELKEAMKK
jgi:hypothetical protein